MVELTGGELVSALSAQLRRRQDDFSMQYALPDDPRFWIRVALPLTRPLVFTDFFTGQQNEATSAAALQAVVADLRLEDPESIEFSKLGPAGAPETVESVERLGRVTDAYVMQQRRFVRLRQVMVDRGQANLRIIFWDSLPKGHEAR